MSRGLTFRKSPFGGLIPELDFAIPSKDQAKATFHRVRELRKIVKCDGLTHPRHGPPSLDLGHHPWVLDTAQRGDGTSEHG
jgi:hypothetical protein